MAFILYEGPSQIDGKPIVVVLTKESRNTKTGAMWQTWIMRADIEPHLATKTGDDESVCGNCIHRPANYKTAGAAICYVLVQNAPLSVYRAYRRGRYVAVDAATLSTLVAGQRVRIGSYGDPAAAPIGIWRAIAGAAAGITGYSHQWRDERFAEYREFLMASVDDAAGALEAMARGWRYFRVAPKGDAAKLDREVSCPASKEMGTKTTCSACRACGGMMARAKASIVIQAH